MKLDAFVGSYVQRDKVYYILTKSNKSFIAITKSNCLHSFIPVGAVFLTPKFKIFMTATVINILNFGVKKTAQD